MAGTDIEPRDPDKIPKDERVELAPHQIRALQKLYDLGAEPAPKSEDGKPVYSKDAQIRALQLMYEGRLGGNQGGAQARSERIGAEMARRMARHVDKMEKVLKKALKGDDLKLGMDAIRLSAEIEHRESRLALEEEKFDAELEKMEKGDLIGELLALARDPLIEASIANQADITLAESEIHEVTSGDNGNSGHSSRPAKSRSGRGKSKAAKRTAASRNRPEDENPWTAAARRRAAN